MVIASIVGGCFAIAVAIIAAILAQQDRSRPLSQGTGTFELTRASDVKPHEEHAIIADSPEQWRILSAVKRFTLAYDWAVYDISLDLARRIVAVGLEYVIMNISGTDQDYVPQGQWDPVARLLRLTCSRENAPPRELKVETHRLHEVAHVHKPSGVLTVSPGGKVHCEVEWEMNMRSRDRQPFVLSYPVLNSVTWRVRFPDPSSRGDVALDTEGVLAAPVEHTGEEGLSLTWKLSGIQFGALLVLSWELLGSTPTERHGAGDAGPATGLTFHDGRRGLEARGSARAPDRSGFHSARGSGGSFRLF